MKKKRKKKNFWYRTWMGYCLIELRAGLGAGLGTGRVAGRTARSRRWASVRAGRAKRARQAGVSGRAKRARHAGVSGRGAQGMLGRAGLACWGAQGGRRTGTGGRTGAGGSVRTWGELQLGAGAGGRQGAGGAAGRWTRGRALGARPGHLGWPWAVHSMHSAHFRSVLTRFFS